MTSSTVVAKWWMKMVEAIIWHHVFRHLQNTKKLISKQDWKLVFIFINLIWDSVARSGVILSILRLYKYKYSICFISKESPQQCGDIYFLQHCNLSFCNSYDIFDPSLPTQSSKIVTVVNRDWVDHFTTYRQHSTHFIISKLFSTGHKGSNQTKATQFSVISPHPHFFFKRY